MVKLCDLGEVFALAQLFADLLVFGARPGLVRIPGGVLLALVLCHEGRERAIEGFDRLRQAADGVCPKSFAGRGMYSVGEGADDGNGFGEFHNASSMADRFTGSL